MPTEIESAADQPSATLDRVLVMSDVVSVTMFMRFALQNPDAYVPDIVVHTIGLKMMIKGQRAHERTTASKC